mgnify:FL=1
MAFDMTLPALRRSVFSAKGWRRRAAALAAVLLGAVAPAQALVQIDITQGQVEPLPIALPTFGSSGR